MGRKKVTKTEEKVDIRLRIDASLAAKIQEVADSESTTVAGYIRAVVVRDLKQREKDEGKR